MLFLSCFSLFACDRGDVKVYKITYDVAGGELPDGAITTYTVSDKSITLPVPTKAGYKFRGWLGNGNKLVTVIAAGSTGDKAFVAVWENLFEVVINNETAASFTAWADKSQDNILHVGYGDKLTIPKIKWDDFSKTRKDSEEYTFEGWFYRDKDNVERQFNSNVAFTLENLNVNAYSVTIYAKVIVQYAGPF